MSVYPFKLQVLRALTDSLKTITPANGFVSDLSDFADASRDGAMTSRVYRGRAWFGDSDPLPMVSILEGVTPADNVAEPPITVPSGEYFWPLVLQGFVGDDKQNPTDPAYLLLADVRQKLAAEAKRKRADDPTESDPLGVGFIGKNRIISLSFGPGVVRPADDLSSNAYFWMSVVLRVFDNPSSPYS